MNSPATITLQNISNITIYPDDILIQARAHQDAKTALATLERACGKLELVICPEKIKIVAGYNPKPNLYLQNN